MMGIFTDYPPLGVFRSKRKPRHPRRATCVEAFSCHLIPDAMLACALAVRGMIHLAMDGLALFFPGYESAL
jgi:hypothetical protein